MPALFAWVRTTVLTMVVAYAASFAPLPWRLIGLPFAAAGLLLGFTACLKAFRNPGSGLILLAASMATLACGLFTVSLGGQALFYAPSYEYQQCMENALTLTSQQQCTTNLENQLIPAPLRRNP